MPGSLNLLNLSLVQVNNQPVPSITYMDVIVSKLVLILKGIINQSFSFFSFKVWDFAIPCSLWPLLKQIFLLYMSTFASWFMIWVVAHLWTFNFDCLKSGSIYFSLNILLQVIRNFWTLGTADDDSLTAKALSKVLLSVFCHLNTVCIVVFSEKGAVLVCITEI
jgi:hypothetical protein